MPYRKEDDHACLLKMQESRAKNQDKREIRIPKINPGKTKVNRLHAKNRRGYFPGSLLF